MTKLELIDSIKANMNVASMKKINFDELSAYVLTLLQYGIKLNHRDAGGDWCDVIGIGPQGIIVKLGNCLYQTMKYPSNISLGDNWLVASIGDDLIQLFERGVRVVRPPKRGCSFGKQMVSIVDMRDEELSGGFELEF